MSTTEEIMDDVSPDELDLWAGGHRKIGKPSNAEIESYDRRDAKIVEIATHCTASYSQTIRHIYYLCSGLGLVGKDHGKESYWYDMVKFAIGVARWNGTLAWHRIADDSRPFNTPAYWDDDRSFLESAVPAFAMDKWKGQSKRVIVCVEKDAIMGMLSGLCRRYHVPIMSFHGQASDGGAIYTLAKYIKDNWIGKCDLVWCLYLGDYDTCGCLIDRVAFGDPKAPTESDAYSGKLMQLLYKLVLEDCDSLAGMPTVMYERIGITPYDVKHSLYERYLLEANNDSNFDRYVEDTNEIEGFPMVWSDTKVKGKARGLVPATLGVDALDHVELIERTKQAIKDEIDLEAWKAQMDNYKTERGKLRKLLL